METSTGPQKYISKPQKRCEDTSKSVLKVRLYCVQ